MKIKSIKKHIASKKSARLAKILFHGLMIGTLLGNTPIAAADDLDDLIEEDNPYSYNTLSVDDDQITFNGRTFVRGESYSFRGQTYSFDDFDFTGEHSWTSHGGRGSADVIGNNITFGLSGQYAFNVNSGNYSGSLVENEITFNNGTYEFNFADTDGFSIDIQDNTLTINDGTFGGANNSFPNSTATGNTFNIYGSPDFSNAYLYGGYLASVGSASNNTLNIYTSGLTAKNIYDFDALNFYLPSSTASGDTILTLTDGATDLNNASVSAIIGGNSSLTEGDYVTLLQNSNGITSIGEMSGRFDEGVTLTYDLEMSGSDNDITLTLGPAQVKDEAALTDSANLNSNDLVSKGTDKLIEWLPPEEFEEASTESNDGAINTEAMSKIAAMQNGFDIFANIGFSNLKTKTGNGSYMKSKGGNFDIGISRAFQNRLGTLIVAPLLDYGKSSYDSYLRTGEKGTGDSHYFAGGIMLRQMNNTGFYYEGSFRGGRANTDFYTKDLYSGNQRTRVGYDASAPIFAGHVRVGKLLRMNKNNLVHVYGIYSHSHQNDMHTHLSTGESYEFDSIDAGKFRLGYRWTTRLNPISKLYTGMAYQYEFNGDSVARYRGHDIPKESIEGSSGILELGWQVKPNREMPWMLDLAVTGWIGQHEGVTAAAKVKKSF